MRKEASSGKKWISPFLLLFILVSPPVSFGQIQGQLKWGQLPDIPVQEGFSAIYAGVSNGSLIYLGGASSSKLQGSENEQRKYYDQIFILEKNASSWKLANEKLPFPIASGVSVSYKEKIIIVGGENGERHFSDVRTVEYKDGRVRLDSLIALPFPLANMSGTVVGDILFIAGGNTKPGAVSENFFLALNLAESTSSQRWVNVDSWPGPSRVFSVSASLLGKFFLFSGINRDKKSDGKMEAIILKDAFVFTPKYNGKQLVGGNWSAISEMPKGVTIGVSPAPIFGSDHILFSGGVDDISDKYTDSFSLLATKRDLWAYHAGSNTWVNLGGIPEGKSSISVPAVWWNQKWVVPSGISSDAKSMSKVFSLSKNLDFGWANWAALIIYLGFMVLIGFYFNKRGQTTSNFFKAGGNIPWWAAGLSIYGTQLSAITFMATPAIVYATDWSLAITSIMILAAVPIVVKYYIPFFRRLNITSAYEYLEHRFSPKIRVIGSLSFILFQLGRMGVVLFLPAIAIAAVTGINIFLIIFIMGIICILYTVMGGIEAVIWADVIQVFILMGGALLCLVVAISEVDGGLSAILSKGIEADKFAMYHTGWDVDKPVLWVLMVGFFFLNIIPYTSDQAIVQRYLTVKDERAAAKSLWTNALVTLPAIPIFFGLGTVLYVFYLENPGNIPSEQVGEILPYFAVQQLPVGIAGVVIAGIFAASQSTLSTSMNSIAAAFVTDIYPRFRMLNNDKDKLRLARLATIVVGFIGIGSAMLVVILNVQFIFDLFQEILGILGGALAGVFILGIFTKRANARGVMYGLISGVIMVWLAKTYTDISVYLYGAISVMTTVLVGFVMSMTGKQTKELQGLTYSTLDKKVKSGTD